MLKPMLVVVAVLAASSAAWAVDTPLPNGSFESPPGTGFTQTITSWTLTPIGATTNGLPVNQQSGLFSSLGGFTSVPNGSQYLLLDNLGTGTVSITSGTGVGDNFKLVDRNLQFRYVYLTNDPVSAGLRDSFTVRVDFFNSIGAAIG